MKIGIWILGDQLHPQQAALASVEQDPLATPILLVESDNWVKQRNYHQQKLALVWSAMRHFAAELGAQGYPVTYSEADDFLQPLLDWIQAHQLDQVRVMVPADIPFRRLLDPWQKQLPCSLVFVENNHFLWAANEFFDWTKGRKRLVMEDFYRQGRKRFEVLMDGDQPVGGRWNFDSENRKPPRNQSFLPPLTFPPDPITQQVIAKVKSQYGDHFGSVESFAWAVTREQSLTVLADFTLHRLGQFGPLQDAMITGEDFLHHALLSPYLNLGLLSPLEVIQAAERAFHQHQLPIASVEGFIRQVLGWREYMRGLYETLMPTGYDQKNGFDHHQPLPEFFWTGDTDMNCLHQVIDQIQRTGYAHHIQRLMVLSNFALISGIHPQQIEAWFHAVFIDSYDWVMQTNVIGMGVFADGGILATKPYAASANYIHKMSDYCRNCRYNHTEKVGEQACPFNVFYWDFLLRHRQTLTNLGRMGLVLSHLDRMDEATSARIRAQADQWWQHNAPALS